METKDRSAKKILEFILSDTGYKQRDIAERTHISEATISRILSDPVYQPNYRTYKKIVLLAQSLIKTVQNHQGEVDMDENKFSDLQRRVSRLEQLLIDLLARGEHDPFRRATLVKTASRF